MILTFVTMTNDINKVPIWECVNGKRGGGNFSCFIRTSAFPKRIMLLGPNASPPYKASDITEAVPGVYVSKMELPYSDLCVAGDDLRPFIETFNPQAPHKNVVVILMDKECDTYLDCVTGASYKEFTESDSVIVNTFHADNWVGCIAILREEFSHGDDSANKIHMYVDYAVVGAPRDRMFREMSIKGNPKGISVTDSPVTDADAAKRLLALFKGPRKLSFRIRTVQRLSNIIIVPEGMKKEATNLFNYGDLPAYYLDDPYDIKVIEMPIDKDTNIVETDDVKKEVATLFERSRTNKNRSVIFYGCRPTTIFFRANLNYIFAAAIPKKGQPVVYRSVISP